MERKFDFTDSVSENTAFMMLDRHIGPDPNDENAPYINGSYFAAEMMYHYENKRKIQIRINSVGGNVIHGWSIVDAVLLTEADTHAAGLAASMAGIILAMGKKRTCNDFSSCMLHGPHGNTDSPYMEMIRSNFKTILGSKTKLGDKKVGEIMDKGDHYFDSSDMLANGIVDEVIPTSVKLKVKPTASVNELYNIYNSYFDTNKPNQFMKTILASLFGGATEDETLNNVVKFKESAVAKQAELEKKLSDALADLAKIKAEKTAVDAELVTLKGADAKAKATKLVADAKAKGVKMSEEEEKNLVALAESNYAGVELIVKNLTVSKKPTVMAALNDDQKKETMTYEYLSKNEPEKLNQIAESDPALYAAMEKEFIESKNAKK